MLTADFPIKEINNKPGRCLLDCHFLINSQVYQKLKKVGKYLCVQYATSYTNRKKSTVCKRKTTNGFNSFIKYR